MKRRGALALALALAGTSLAGACSTGFDLAFAPGPPSGWPVALQSSPGRLTLAWAPLDGVTSYSVSLALATGGQPVASELVSCGSLADCRWTSARLDTSGTLFYTASVSANGESSIPLKAQPLPAGWATLRPSRAPWTYPSTGTNNFAFRVWQLGRVNGDDYDDFVVLSPDENGSIGAAFVMLGGDPTPQPTVVSGTAAGDRFGASAVSAGTSGDGFGAFVVSHTHPSAGAPGGLTLFRGNETGFDLDPTFMASGTIGGEYGAALAYGDFDGVPGGDLLVAEPSFDGTNTNEGRIRIRSSLTDTDANFLTTPFLLANARTGSQLIGMGNVMGGPREEAAYTACSATCGNLALATVYATVHGSDGDFAVIATDVDATGDINGDGWDDVVTGHDFRNQADVWLGGPAPPLTHVLHLGSAFDMNQNLGGRICGVGDVTADGFAETVILDAAWPGPPSPDQFGKAYLFFGGSAGVSTNAMAVYQGATSTSVLARCGATGDSDGDGTRDFMLGDLSTVFLHYGPRAGGPFVMFASVNVTATEQGIAFEGALGAARTATTVTCAWDFGDGTTGTGCTPPAPHAYDPGVYDVRLTVTDELGFTAAGGLRLTVP